MTAEDNGHRALQEEEVVQLYALLDELGIAYERYGHEAAYTVEQADAFYGHLPGGHSKNLFLRNKKGDRHYLVVAESHKPVDLKALRGVLGESTLSFASPERLWRHLRLTPGSVSPLGLMHDAAQAVTVVLDRDLLEHDVLNFHPNINTATVAIGREDFRRFLAHCGHEVRVLELSP